MSICSVNGLKPFFPQAFRLFLVIAVLTVPAMFCGCRNPIDTSSLNSLAKSDIDMIADTSLREMNRLMEELLEKLYRLNPHELDKQKGMTVGQRQNQVFDKPGRLIFKELDNRQGTDALNLAFNSDYHGDRVFALMAGLLGVVRSSYNWQTEQFMFDSLDQQKLFDSARNIEVLAWRLSQARDASGGLLLISSNQVSKEENPSFERLFGKMISIQDMMAFAIAGKWERGVTHVLHSAAFLPMGM